MTERIPSPGTLKKSRHPFIQAEVEEISKKVTTLKVNEGVKPEDINRQARSLTAHHLITRRIKQSFFRILQAQQKQMEEASKLAMIDPLTGLLNAEGFNEAIGKEIVRSERTGDEIALLFIDMNGLGKVNNELGHAVGDARLKTAADILAVSFRPTDIVARLGDKADEFVAAIPMKDVRTIEARYAEVNKNAVAANFNWEDYPITLPAGAVKLDKNDVPGSITRADHAMYKAKELSKNIGENVIRYEPETVAV